MNVADIQKRQEAQYHFPYHYIPYIEGNKFSQSKTLKCKLDILLITKQSIPKTNKNDKRRKRYNTIKGGIFIASFYIASDYCAIKD